MVIGYACYLTFSNNESEIRFKEWVKLGNERSDSMGLSSLWITASMRKVGNKKYLFLWEHVFLFSMSWLLHLMLWYSLKRVRKYVIISPVNKLDLVKTIIVRGLK